MREIHELGWYLHVPFCRQICPYCPYNKELFHPDMAQRYAAAVMREIDLYAAIVGSRPVTSFYIGGGTPTTMLNQGLGEVLDHVREVFNVRCDVHMESHPNDLSDENLDAIQSLGVTRLSTGVESLEDRYLRFLIRPYTAAVARQAIERTVKRNFQCVNADVMFALPGQTCQEVEQAAKALVGLGVDQVAAYPLFRFPYTLLGGNGEPGNYFKAWQLLGFSRDDGQRITLTDRGAYWLHALEDIFSIEYVSRLWGTSKQERWPQKVLL